MEYNEDLTSDQLMEAEAYAVLFALGGYTYSNIVEEGLPEAAIAVEEGEEVAHDYLVDGDDDAESSSKVDEESLIRQMSLYEQKFIGPCLVKPSNRQGSCIALQ